MRAWVWMLAIVGCGGGDEPPKMEFEEAGNIPIEAAMTAAMGGGISLARYAVQQAAEDAAETGCPTVEETAEGTRYIGGCTAEGDDEYTGEALARNLDGSDAEAPVELELDAFGTGRQSFDGTTSEGPFTAEGRDITADLDADVFGQTLGFRGTLSCGTTCSPTVFCSSMW